MSYPNTAGFKGRVETGRAGAEHANATLGRRRAEALEALKALGEASADQVAEKIGRHWFHVRPRFSEMKALGYVQDTGRRVATGLGGNTVVYRPSTVEELAVALARKAADAEHGEGAE
jgi:predicted ArsR family transcriptional regulator